MSFDNPVLVVEQYFNHMSGCLKITSFDLPALLTLWSDFPQSVSTTDRIMTAAEVYGTENLYGVALDKREKQDKGGYIIIISVGKNDPWSFQKLEAKTKKTYRLLEIMIYYCN